MHWLERHWYRRTPVSVALWPLGALYCLLMILRYGAYRAGLLRSTKLSVPVIVIGNITVGGTGKTPLVIWLAKYLRDQGHRPGVITRGYRGRARAWPQMVTPDSDPEMVGDEPVLIARAGNCPVVADPDRVRGAKRLTEQGCDVIVSDDGLQHYRLARDIEVAVLDGERRLGNGWWLPAGPLREPAGRLGSVDYRVIQGKASAGEWGMTLTDRILCKVGGGSTSTIQEFSGQKVHAVAGIGNPKRFFDDLRALGMQPIEHPFPDHHAYRADDLAFDATHRIVMTEKDAVKCERFGIDAWYLRVAAQPEVGFSEHLLRTLKESARG